MNTSAGYQQSPRPPRVPLDEVMVKLYPEGFNQEFEADAVNVGAGGLSIRSNVLPQVGSSLRCRFDHPTGGEPIRIVGQVVWAHESGQHVGEFGLRFTQLDVSDHARIDDLVTTWNSRTRGEQAPAVRLQLDGVPSPIVAKVRNEDGASLRVEQELPFLTIGSGIENQENGRHGRLQEVELEVRDDVPRLVLSIGYDALANGSTPAQEPRIVTPEMTAQEAFADDIDTLQDDDFDDAAEQLNVAAAVGREEDRPVTLMPPLLTAGKHARRLGGRAWSSAANVAKRSGSMVSVGAGHSKMAGTAVALRLKRWIIAAWTWLSATMVPGVWGAVKLTALRTHRFFSSLVGKRAGARRKRRTQRVRSGRATNTRRSEGPAVKPILIGVALSVCAWSAYHVVSSRAAIGASTQQPAAVAEPEQAVERTTAPAEAPATAAMPQEPVLANTHVDAFANAAPPPAGNQHARIGATSQPVAAAAPPVVSPSAAQQTVNAKTFGAATVPDAEIFTLRMNSPVRRMEGIIDDDGFSVTIPGSLSLSRAGPIAAAHPDVERASILNRGDVSELTLRFVAGRTPAYRVEAIGTNIEISIER